MHCKTILSEPKPLYYHSRYVQFIRLNEHQLNCIRTLESAGNQVRFYSLNVSLAILISCPRHRASNLERRNYHTTDHRASLIIIAHYSHLLA
jgi:hypothetical protein